MEHDKKDVQHLQSKEKKRKTLFLVIGFVFSAVCLWYVFGNIDLDKLLASRHRILYLPLLASIAAYWCGVVVVRSFLVRHLLSPVGTLSFSKTYRYVCIGFLANNILPFKMGEVVRIGGLSRASGISFASVTGAAAIERLLDMVMAAIIGLLAILFAPLPQKIRVAVLVASGGFFIALIVLILLSRRHLKEIPQTSKGKLKITIWNLIVRFVDGLGALGTSRGALGAIVMSMVIWAIIIGVIALRLIAFGLPPDLPLILVLIIGLVLAVTLPSAPAYVGLYHAGAVTAMMLFADELAIDRETAVGFAIFCHFADVIPGCLLGAISMILEGVKLADLKQDRQQRAKTLAQPK